MEKKVLKKAKQGTSTPKFKPGQISAKRTYEIADSLTKKAQLQAGATDFGRAKYPKELLQSSEANYQKADRLRSLADKAMKDAAPKKKMGGMIKRADGSMSKRGLWDNLRSKAAQNKKTGAKPKAPTAAMLKQEKKIKANTKKK
jgi:hypothetical protein